MEKTTVGMNNFEGGWGISMGERAQQVQMETLMACSMNTYQLPTPQPTGVPATKIDIKLIRRDGGTHSRSMLNEITRDEYAAAMARGEVFPPISLFHDGKEYWLADGFHTLSAAQQAGFETIAAYIYSGTDRDARLYAAQANAKHGQRRTNADKNRCVQLMFADAEWRLWTDRDIADHCGVDNAFVSRLRQAMIEKLTANPDLGAEGAQEAVDGQHTKSSPSVLPTTKIHEQTRALVRNTILEDNLFEVRALALHTLETQKKIMKVIADGKITTVLDASRDLKKQKSNAKLNQRLKALHESGFECSDFVQGDCLEKLSLLPPKSVRLLLSDVPYGMGLKNKKRVASEDWAPIAGDKDIKEAVKLLKNMLDAIDSAMQDESHALIFSHQRYQHIFSRVLRLKGYSVRDVLVWVKGQHGVGYTGGFAPKYECIIHAVRGGATIQPRLPNALVVPAEHTTTHVCEKPTELLRQLIGCTTLPGDLVADPFAGTGATLVTAQQQGRRFFGVELEENYHQQGLARLESLQREPSVGSLPPVSQNTYQEEVSAEEQRAA